LPNVIRLKRLKPKKDRAAQFADWLAAVFVVPGGLSRGKPFTLHPFQMEFLRGYLSRDADGSPTYRTSIFSVGRKNGKSTLVAAILLGHMLPDSPLYIPNFRAAIAAPTSKHSKLLADAAAELMVAAGRGDECRVLWHPAPGRLIAGTGTVLLSSGAKSAGHGQDLDLAVVDEAGLLPTRQTEVISNYFDSLATKDGQLLLLGTRGDSPEFNRIIDAKDPRTFKAVFGAELGDDPSDPAVWAKANPGLGAIKSRRFMEDAYEKAAAGGSLAAFQAWQLNMRLDPSRELLLDYRTVAKAYSDTAEPLPGESCFVGLDLGGAASMTAAVVVFESGCIRLIGAFPSADMNLIDRGKRDLVGDLWQRCADTGEIFQTSGSVSDLAEFLPELVKLIGPHPVRSVTADRYREEECRTALYKAGIAWPVNFRSNGPKDGSADIMATRKLFLAGAVKLKRSILLEGSLGEADVRVAQTGSTRLDKSQHNSRIDIAQALTLACGAMLRARETPEIEYEVEVV
jgi:phage terminase large subunit-like protein